MSGSLTILPTDGGVFAGQWEGRLQASDGAGELDGAATSGNFSSTVCNLPTADTLIWY